MRLKSIELSGFKSFPKKSILEFTSPITAVVGPNGSGKSNVVEAFRFVLGEQSIKSMRGKKGEDLIWNGSNNTPRSNRALARVILNNQETEAQRRKLFPNIDFSEVSIERVVNRDGANEYSLNGSTVRLKDIVELLHGAHIGSSGHHIISQGEADRILNSSPKDRRALIEDALGLKLYQFKKEESTKKLEKTFENISQVSSLRKEIAPHLRFLRKQVEKIEKAENMREELLRLSHEYFYLEDLHIKNTKKQIQEEKVPIEKRLTAIREELIQAKSVLSEKESQSERELEILGLETEIAGTRAVRDGLTRELGKVEGLLSVEERILEKEKSIIASSREKMVRFEEVEEIGRIVDAETEGAGRITDSSLLHGIIARVRKEVSDFIQSRRNTLDPARLRGMEDRIGTLHKERAKIEQELIDIEEKEAKLNLNYKDLKRKIDSDKDTSREAEKTIFRIMAEENELVATRRLLEQREETLRLEEEEYKRELEEVGYLIGVEAIRFSHKSDIKPEEDRTIQDERKRAIQKLKIRLEDAGLSGAQDVLKEFKETSERDEFLSREILDLETSASALEKLIKELEERINQEFLKGIERINKEFGNFFREMFDGGEAKLVILKEVKKQPSADELDELSPTEEKTEEGLDISVSLPRKKIKGLVMLSGGERALTSIALIFAISQVNPPPFIILDETDAALDEANSKRYGDMIEKLAKKSQLILVTHNRETMSRAGKIYGVTMDREGVSKLLTIDFEKAVEVAK